MVKIHGIVYLIIGAAVLFTSNKIDSQKFQLFIWVGYLFLVIGIAKLGIGFIKRKKESPAERKDLGNIYQQQTGQTAQFQQQRAARHCPRCRFQLQGYENFCPGCGQRLR